MNQQSLCRNWTCWEGDENKYSQQSMQSENEKDGQGQYDDEVRLWTHWLFSKPPTWELNMTYDTLLPVRVMQQTLSVRAIQIRTQTQSDATCTIALDLCTIWIRFMCRPSRNMDDTHHGRLPYIRTIFLSITSEYHLSIRSKHTHRASPPWCRFALSRVPIWLSESDCRIGTAALPILTRF